MQGVGGGRGGGWIAQHFLMGCVGIVGGSGELVGGGFLGVRELMMKTAKVVLLLL